MLKHRNATTTPATIDPATMYATTPRTSATTAAAVVRHIGKRPARAVEYAALARLLDDATTPATTTAAAIRAAAVVVKNAPTPADFADDDPAAAFAAVRRAFENDYAAGDFAESLQALATFAAACVVKRLCDPDAKRAATDSRASAAGCNPVMLQLRREVYADLGALDDLRDLCDRATRYTTTADGDPVREVVDPAADRAAAALERATLGDGCDLVQTATVAILEAAEKYANLGTGWLDATVNVRRLARRVYLDREAVATWRDATTTPIQEVFRAVRRYIDTTRAVQTDPRNGYSYIADFAADPDGDGDATEVIYFRLGKYADLGGYAANGKSLEALAGSPAGYASGDGCGDGYTVGTATAEAYDATLARLDLTEREAAIIAARMRGDGIDATARRLGISTRTVERSLATLQAKAAAAGIVPHGWKPDDRKGDVARAVVQCDPATGATVATFASAAAAARSTGADKGSIARAAKRAGDGKPATAGGYAWKYGTVEAATMREIDATEAEAEAVAAVVR